MDQSKTAIIGFFVGLLLFLLVPASEFWSVLIGTLIVLILSVFLVFRFARQRTDGRLSCVFLGSGLIGAFTVFGSVWIYWGHALDESLISTDLQLTVRIQGVPEIQDSHSRFLASVLSCDSCDGKFSPELIQLYWFGPERPGLEPLDVWQLSVRLKPLEGLRNPHTFDLVAWALQNGIHATGYVNARLEQQQVSSHQGFNLHGIRKNFATRLTELASADRNVALVQALTLGLKAGIDAEALQILRDTGTAHLVAISGLHISLFAVFGFRIARCIQMMIKPIGVLINKRCIGSRDINSSIAQLRRFVPDGYRLALLTSVVFATAYAALAGFALPTQRALIMVLVWAAARSQQRPLATDIALLFAVLGVLLLEPLSPVGAGFWLSFGTVALIVYLHRGRLIDRSSFSTRLFGLVRSHLLLGVLLLPITMWFFQSAVLVSPLANLVAIPLVSLIVVPLAMLSLILAMLHPDLAAVVLSLCQWCVLHLLKYLSWCQTLALSSPPATLPDLEYVVLAIFGLALFCAPRGLGLRIVGAPLVAPALFFSLSAPRISGVELHVLDVGQGFASLILTEHSTTLFDTGPGFGTSTLFNRVVQPYLRGIGRHQIDTLIVSHGDNDHAGGIDAVLAQNPSLTLIHSPVLDEVSTLDARSCLAGDTWVQDDVWFSFLHPGAGDGGSENDQSCVLLVFHGQSRLLLTGDIEHAAEQRLLRRLALSDNAFPIDVMLAPHHGSRSSSSQVLVDKLQPAHVVFPAGNRNRYGFPHAEVQLRYKLVGAKSYVTGRDGATVFRLGEAGLREPPQIWRNAHRRFWHGKD